ncbi:unnamed protein product [Danaus chrysippus]|uniref:(African queen) hypothetical protein n=1 Tax=Danaus chrysippus TaxID=151541 RepID=A0A8J2R9R1_9NEOP|nr:unnamed protein product [Danaus chrysippus]
MVTRNCTDNKWEPPAAELQPCMMAENIYNLSGCPPGFNKISKNNDDLCYQIGKPREWNYPCLKSGGASVITDLSSEDTITLLQSLNARNISRYFWLPAKRQKFFNPIIWQIPGPKWGHPVESRNFLKTRFWFLHACLLLDIKENVLITEACTEKYPSLCFYINELHYPAKCPEKYMSVRYLPDDGTCFGIEQSDTNLTFQDFVTKKCETPMGDRDSELTRFIFKNIAKFNNLPEDVWCWFTSLERNVTSNTGNYFNSTNTFMTINSVGTVSLTNNEDEQSLPCMACQTAVTYPEAELNFEYSEEEKLIYLTIYHPSSLWKYNQYDRGIQCFSDGNGLVKVVHIDDYPVLEIKEILNFKNSDTDNVDKIVYAISLITQRSAQYWCEGHTKNFSLISTHKLVVNPLGEEHS